MASHLAEQTQKGFLLKNVNKSLDPQDGESAETAPAIVSLTWTDDSRDASGSAKCPVELAGNKLGRDFSISRRRNLGKLNGRGCSLLNS